MEKSAQVIDEKEVAERHYGQRVRKWMKTQWLVGSQEGAGAGTMSGRRGQFEM
jgi:hypothetical protein